MRNIENLLEQAQILYRQKKFQQAEEICQQMIQNNPQNAPALHLLSLIAYQKETYEEAQQWLERAMQVSPDTHYYYTQLGNIRHAQGKLQLAQKMYEKSLSLKKDDPETCNNLGNLMMVQENIEAAFHWYLKALEYNPEFADAHNNLALLLQSRGETTAAMAHFRKSLDLNPNQARVHENMGDISLSVGKRKQALHHYRQALLIDPKRREIYPKLAYTYLLMHNLKKAFSIYQAGEVDDNPAHIYSRMGKWCQTLSRHQDAFWCYQQALGLDPNNPTLYRKMGTTVREMGKIQMAMAFYQKSLKLQPNSPHTNNVFASLLKVTGHTDVALEYYRKVLELASKDTDISPSQYASFHSNLLLCMLATPGISQADFYKEARQWNQLHGEPLSRDTHTFSNIVDPYRRLRIGYISADFRSHSAAAGFQMLFQNHDRTQFEIIAYAEVHKPDKVTTAFQESADRWCSIVGMSDQEVAHLINKDQIDILVDLSGHTAHHRLLVMAHKPAPVQFTGLGFGSGTTGLTAIDYRFTDRIQMRREEPSSEQRIGLSSLLHWLPPPWDLPITPLSQRKHIHFGCGNELFKINDQVIKIWGSILCQIPDSRLHIKNHQCNDPHIQQMMQKRFSENGISPERLLFSGTTPHREHVQFYQAIDIALDPFPYHGGISTCEALWMGVPVITLDEGTCTGVSMMSVLNKPELIAADRTSYIQIAVDLAQNKKRLIALRSTLRDQLQQSPICDGEGFTREVEAAYREAWEKWCGSVIN